MEKRDCRVFEEVFHAVVDKAQGIAGKMEKLFQSPLRIIDAPVISLCLKKYDGAKYRKAKAKLDPQIKNINHQVQPQEKHGGLPRGPVSGRRLPQSEHPLFPGLLLGLPNILERLPVNFFPGNRIPDGDPHGLQYRIDSAP
jgi:hypothetical protein